MYKTTEPGPCGRNMAQLKRSVKQRLTAAAEEIFELFERTIAEYEEELGRHRKLLDAAFKPQVQLHRADVKQLLVSDEDPPELSRIKEEQEVRTGPEGEQPQEMETEEAAIKFTVTLRAEDDAEKKPQSSKLIQTGEMSGAEFVKTEAAVEICGGPEPEPARTSDPGRHLQPDTRDKMPQTCGTENAAEPKTDDPRPVTPLNPRPVTLLNPRPVTLLNPRPVTPLNPRPVRMLIPRTMTQLNPSPVIPLTPRPATPTESDTDDSSDWGDTPTPQSDLNPVQNDEEPGSDLEADTEKTSVNQSERATGPEDEGQLQNQDRETEKPFSCSSCCKRFSRRGALAAHTRTHTGDKPFPCSVCASSFKSRAHLTTHMRTHTGERPYRCSVCGRGFTQRGAMKRHLSVHTEIRPVSCTVCVKKYKNMRCLKTHMKQHLADESGRDGDVCSADGSQQV